MPGKGTVWLVSQYEPDPGDTFRPLRSQYVARALLARGYTVVQWCACYSHRTRNTVAHAWEEREVEPGWIVRFVPNPRYEENVGTMRLLSESRFARNFRRRAKTEPKPVCIVMREPPCVLGEMSLKLGKHFNVPVICDVIDLWPEFFHRLLPRGTQGMGRTVFGPLYARRRKVWSSVDALIAVSKDYVAHAIKEAPALRNVPTACIYTSIEVDFVQERLKKHSEIVAKSLGDKPKDELWVGYAGTLGLSYEIPTFLRAAEMLKARGAKVRFIVAGAGPMVEMVQEAATKEGSNITFMGILRPDDLYPMLGRCDVSLLSYSADTTVAIPDKFYDYAAAGLPLVNSLQGEVKGMIERHGIGVTYTPGDAESMVAAIEGLARDPARRAAMGARAVEAARSWDAPEHFQHYADLIEESIHRKATGHARGIETEAKEARRVEAEARV